MSAEPPSSPTDTNSTDVTDAPGGVSRKDRKRQEREAKHQAALDELVQAADQVNGPGDSPFTVTLESDATNEGSRNVTFNKVSVSVNGKPLFKDTTVRLTAGCRYGLMGPNGRGKSTLLRLLNSRELPVQQSLDILLVEQEQEIHGGDTPAVLAVVQSHKLCMQYTHEVEKLRQTAELSGEQLERLKFLEDELLFMGAQEAESKARRILYGLGFPTDWHDRPTSSFSGGWRKRIALASAVFIEPDLLMLDEPTNHLDLNAVIWLETYLHTKYSETARRPKTLIVVSHDADFLDSICSHIVHIENFKLNYYKGGFSQFDSQVEARHAEIDRKYEAVTKQITERKKKGMTNDQAKEWIKEQVRIGKIDPEYLEKRRDYTVTFPLSQPTELRDSSIIKLDNVDFNYPGCPTLFRNLSCALWMDSRITLCGPNGIGKSTLLNLMTGLLEPVAGFVTINRQVRISRYNQHFVDKLPLERTPVEYLRTLGVSDDFEARKMLGSFGLEGLAHTNMIATLSGGQKARVAFAAISAEKPHFILFDEPTNHLDVESIAALCMAINTFRGGILVVTHDARLIRETNMAIWIAGDLTVQPFHGELEDYKTHVRRLHEVEELTRERERADKAAVKQELRQVAHEENPVAALEAKKAEKKEQEKVKLSGFFKPKPKK